MNRMIWPAYRALFGLLLLTGCQGGSSGNMFSNHFSAADQPVVGTSRPALDEQASPPNLRPVPRIEVAPDGTEWEVVTDPDRPLPGAAP